MIAGLLLAAGRSRRFGGDKLLAPLRGRRVVRWSAEAVANAVDQLYVVTGPGAHELVRALGGWMSYWWSTLAGMAGWVPPSRPASRR